MTPDSTVDGTPQTGEISLVEALWRYRLMSLIIVLACVLASVAATQILFNKVTATASFAVTDPTNNNNALRMGIVSGPGFATYTAQRAAFARSAPVLGRAAQIVVSKRGPKLSLEGMRASVQTATKPDGGVVIVTASGPNMATAAVVANAVLQSYVELTLSTNSDKLTAQLKGIQAAEKKLSDAIATADRGSGEYRAMVANLTKLQGQESGLLTAQANANDGVQFTDNADPNAAPPSKLPKNAAIGLVLGLLIACVTSFLRASSPRPRNLSRPGMPSLRGAGSRSPAKSPARSAARSAGKTAAKWRKPRRAAAADKVADRVQTVWPPQDVFGPAYGPEQKGDAESIAELASRTGRDPGPAPGKSSRTGKFSSPGNPSPGKKSPRPATGEAETRTDLPQVPDLPELPDLPESGSGSGRSRKVRGGDEDDAPGAAPDENGNGDRTNGGVAERAGRRGFISYDFDA